MMRFNKPKLFHHVCHITYPQWVNILCHKKYLVRVYLHIFILLKGRGGWRNEGHRLGIGKGKMENRERMDRVEEWNGEWGKVSPIIKNLFVITGSSIIIIIQPQTYLYRHVNPCVLNAFNKVPRKNDYV